MAFYTIFTYNDENECLSLSCSAFSSVARSLPFTITTIEPLAHRFDTLWNIFINSPSRAIANEINRDRPIVCVLVLERSNAFQRKTRVPYILHRLHFTQSIMIMYISHIYQFHRLCALSDKLDRGRNMKREREKESMRLSETERELNRQFTYISYEWQMSN